MSHPTRNFSAVSGPPSPEDKIAGTAGMLLLVVWEPKISFLTASGLLRIVMLVEVVIAGTFMAIYIGKFACPYESWMSGIEFNDIVIFSYVHQYNSLDSQPDVLKSLYSPRQPSSSLEGLRYYDGRLADQQMALLQYQRENIHFLCEEILRLQEYLSKYETSHGGIAPQVDLAHLLAARDQELRTLSAEMDHLQSELQLARSFIAEKDAESHRICVTNNQFIEENERLRAILGEWSTRAAKLERALEAERVLNLDLQKNIMRLKNRSSEVVEPSEKD
ncbi:hypothetical protein KSS87_008894 [Heliosperma pusillum]|nr:hypothetical protein KSS87_008894 [Heliosperma pusillum]